jgi:uncharacterized protein (TIGR00730 family)
MKSLVVYCGASSGHNPLYADTAYQVGKFLATKDITVIYGGAQVGIMGAVANGALDSDGQVIGILPTFLRKKEIAHEGVTQIIATDTMHQRKQLMDEMGDGCIILPGGYGTLDEMFEMLTWGQLHLHTKPIGVLNVNGFYNHLMAMTDHMVSEGFVSVENRNMILVDNTIEGLYNQMMQYQAPVGHKWV